MKVLWVFNHPAPYKVDFFNELGKKCELTVLFERPSESDRNPAFYYEKAINFKCHILKSLILGRCNNWTREVVHIIKKEHFDIIVMNGYSTFTEMNAIRYLQAKKIPYIFAINGGLIRQSESVLRRYLKKKYISNAALYLAPDPNSAEYLKFYGAKEDLIRLYPYSTIFNKEVLTTPITPSQQEAFRKKEGFNCKRLYVSVGQFISRKNNFSLLEQWKTMPETSTLLMVGNGPEKKDYEKFILENKLHNVVIKDYEPHQKILSLFQMADFSIFLTKEDIYGHVVNEALSQATPVIASTKANSALNLIEDGKNGYLVNLDNKDEIVSALNHEPNELLRLGALETAKKNTIETMAARHLEVFEEFLKK
jgi:glycosyltransferase involved in cell wall biosynthesis